MKKTAILLLLALSMYVLAACSGSTAETTAAAGDATTAAETAATEAAAETAAEAETTGTTDPDAINALVSALEVVEPENLGSVSKLGDYKGIEVEKVDHTEITDEYVDSYIAENILVNYTEETTEPIQDGDVANIDYEGKKDGVAFDGGTAEGYDLEIGSGTFIDGFESGLIGKKAGETVDLNLKFPEDYASADLAGQDVVFTVKINSVKRQSELTDAIAEELEPGVGSAAAFKEMVKQGLQQSTDLTEKQNLYYNAVKAVAADSEVVPTEEAITYTVNNYIKEYAEYVSSSYGIDFGTMLSYYGMSYEAFLEYYRESAEESMRQRLILEEVAKKENIELTEEDIEAFAEEYSYTVEDLYEAAGGEETARKLILEEKANKLIVDNAVLVDAAE